MEDELLDRKALQALGCWTGYRVERAEWPAEGSQTLALHLKPVSKVMICEECGKRCQQLHETTVRRIRDLPLFEYRVELHVPRRRIWCEHCGGPRLERQECLGRYQGITARFAKAREVLLKSSNVRAVARLYGLDWHTVKAIDKAGLAASLAEPDWTQVRYLAGFWEASIETLTDGCSPIARVHCI